MRKPGLSTPVTNRSCHDALIALTVSSGQLLSSLLSGHPPPRSSRLDCPYDSGQLIGDDELATQVGVSAVADAEEALLASTGMLPRR
jgi:hypothetical protein